MCRRLVKDRVMWGVIVWVCITYSSPGSWIIPSTAVCPQMYSEKMSSFQFSKQTIVVAVYLIIYCSFPHFTVLIIRFTDTAIVHQSDKYTVIHLLSVLMCVSRYKIVILTSKMWVPHTSPGLGIVWLKCACGDIPYRSKTYCTAGPHTHWTWNQEFNVPATPKN